MIIERTTLKQPHERFAQRGITLVETMVTVSIVAILAATAVPGMAELIRDTRRNASVSDIVTALNLARSESVRRGGPVTVCPSVNGVDCTGDVLWETGWMVFADSNRNETVDGAEVVLKRWPARSDVTTLRGARKKVVYRGDGFSAGYTDTLKVCDARGAEYARSVIISNTGRVRVRDKADVCP
jgi:type IV fimbrial biogenesis protein FimT